MWSHGRIICPVENLCRTCMGIHLPPRDSLESRPRSVVRPHPRFTERTRPGPHACRQSHKTRDLTTPDRIEVCSLSILCPVGGCDIDLCDAISGRTLHWCVCHRRNRYWGQSRWEERSLSILRSALSARRSTDQNNVIDGLPCYQKVPTNVFVTPCTLWSSVPSHKTLCVAWMYTHSYYENHDPVIKYKLQEGGGARRT
jgi:hypothetical protein